ncbi:MAG: LpxI family protein [Alphaproteobacteria bacterium]
MKKIILIMGGGNLPIEIIKNLKTKKIEFYCLAFINNPVSKVIKNYDHKIINFGKIITELIFLRSKGFEQVLMTGHLRRPNLNEIKPDLNSLKLFPRFAKVLLQGGDNNILDFSIKYLKEIGFDTLDLRKIIPDNFLGYDRQSKRKIKDLNYKDVKKGESILNSISKFDIGQSIIIQNGNVIGIEAAQGTDNLIKQSLSLINVKDEAVLIKLVKKNQNLKADLPTIGLQTVINCKKSSIKGIAFSANKTLFISKEKVIKYCNENNIFLLGI